MGLGSLLNGIIYAIIGVVVFTAAVLILAHSLPGKLWEKALQENNMAAAVVLAALLLALGWIVAAAVH
jgi:uncharacterized membrane protein YjfL (UPF0719 family)